MRTRALGLLLLLLAAAGCGTQSDDTLAPAPPSRFPVVAPPAACPAGAGPCVDVYVVAHEDDDLLFMNPDIANSIAQGNHVVVVHLTAGDVTPAGLAHAPDHPSAQQYWMDRERGSLNAYTFMARGDAYTAYAPGNAISAYWTKVTDAPSTTSITIGGVQLAEYDLAVGPQVISLVFLRLSDTQLQDAWANRPGRGGKYGKDGTGAPLDAPLAAGSVQTVPCTDCPLGTDIPQQVLTRDQLDAVLYGVIERFTAGSPYSAVSFQDASGLSIDGYGTPRSCDPDDSDHGAGCGYYDYWDHVFGAKFALSAALAVQAKRASPLWLRQYRDYSISREPSNLSTCPAGSPWCDSETTSKTFVMGYYGLYDDGLVDHGARGFSVTEPSFQRAVSARNRKHYDPVANKPATFDDYDANDPYGWESRQVESRSLVDRGLLRGRLSANGACLGASGTTLVPVACGDAPVWDLTTGGQVQLTGTDFCATVTRSAAIPPTKSEPVVLGPCARADRAAVMVMFGNDQIRTANAKCLSMTSTVTSVVCTNPHDTDPAAHPHAVDRPDPDQRWKLIFP